MENLYTDEELALFKSLEDDIDNGTYKPMPREEFNKEMQFYKKVAADTIKERTKKKSLNIRLFEDDIEKIKALALEQGLPYQTLISSVIHKIAIKQIQV